MLEKSIKYKWSVGKGQQACFVKGQRLR